MCGEPNEVPSVIWDAFEISMSSATTFDLQLNDGGLREYLPFHPGKCFQDWGSDEWNQYGMMRILGQGCQLNNPDIDSCYRKALFPYPVPPNSSVMKIDLWAQSNGSWLDLETYTRFQKSRNTSATPGFFGIEVCGTTAGCTADSSGNCVPAFTFIAQDPNSSNDKLTAADMWTGTEFIPSNNIWSVVEEWEQPYATPEMGPYPPCPEDEQGRAMTCTGNETFEILFRNLTIEKAEVKDDGTVTFVVSYALEWGDRFAVHPCTQNLFNIRTGGHQYKVPSTKYWTPTLTSTPSKQSPKVLSAAKKLGVSLGFGNPVKEALWDDVPWPAQLTLSRSYKVEHFPDVTLDWSQYPFDSQDLTLVLSEESIEPGLVEFDFSEVQFSHDKVDIGSGWKKESASYEIVNHGGREAVKLTVRVKRDPTSKVYTLLIPVMSAVALQIAFITLSDFGDTSGIFMTEAVAVSVSVALLNPSILGFPSTVPVMPFIQAFVLMAVVGVLLSCILVLLRIVWEFRMSKLQKNIDLLLNKFGVAVSTFGLDHAKAREVITSGSTKGEDAANDKPPPGEGEFREYHDLFTTKEKLRLQLKRYDRFIRIFVVAWYLISLLAVSGGYGVI